MKNFRFHFLIVYVLMTFPCWAQSFMEPINPNATDFLFGRPCMVTLSSGQELHGTIRGTSVMSNRILSISVHLDNGKNVKYKPDDLVSIRVKPHRSVFDIIKESGIPVSGEVLEDIKDQIERECITFTSVSIDEKADKLRFLQLLNPGFDSKIKVYALVRKDLKIVRITDGESEDDEVDSKASDESYHTVYMFVKKGEEPLKVRDYSYSLNFSSIYADCPQMLKIFSGENLRLDDMAGHVWVYDRMCE
jgi:hypothetical protein